MLCTRLTLFNARRGGKPCRLTVTQWEKRTQWIDKSALQEMNDEDKSLVDELDIVYTTGKGNHLVSCMIPKDTVPGIIVMCNPEARRLAGVPLRNPFLFPHTNSTHHCGGSDVLNTVCK